MKVYYSDVGFGCILPILSINLFLLLSPFRKCMPVCPYFWVALLPEIGCTMGATLHFSPPPASFRDRCSAPVGSANDANYEDYGMSGRGIEQNVQ